MAEEAGAGDGSAAGGPPAKRARKEGGGSVRYKKLQEAFSMATHAVLTACSQQDFVALFGFVRPEMQSQVYELYTEVVAAVHKASKDEFESICAEMKLKEVLSDIDKRIAAMLSSAKRISIPQEEKPPSLLVAKDAIDAKRSEVDELNRILYEEERRRSQLLTRINAMRTEIENLEDKGTPALVKLKQALQTASGDL